MHKHFELYDCGLQPECGGRERRGRQRQGSNELSAGLLKNALCGVADGPLYVCASLFRNAFKMRFSVSKLHSRPSNPAYWAPKREGLPTAMERTASKNAPGRQIQVAGPQSENGYRPQLLRRRRKTLLAAKYSSRGPKARRTTDRNCSDGVEKHFQPPNPRRWAPKGESKKGYRP